MNNPVRSHIFSVDAETDDLFGETWAIGVVVLDKDGNQVDKFEGQVDPSDVRSAWVQEHSVPFCKLTPYPNRRALRDAFWEFWMFWRERAIAVADCGAPVEAGLFRACVEDDLEGRQWKHPFPLHDLGTLLHLCGYDPADVNGDADRIKLAKLEGEELHKHNPVDDAYASGLCWVLFSQKIRVLR
jgi:hypothetical protein